MEKPSPELRRWLDWPVIFALLALLLVAPIPLGSKHPPAAHALNVVIAMLGAFWFAGAAVTTPPQLRLRGATAWVFALFVLFTAYLWLLSIPLPHNFVSRLNPKVAEFYRALPVSLAVDAAPLSLDRGATMERAMRSTAMLLVFALTLLTVNTKRRITVFAAGLALIGTLHALFALLDLQAGGTLFRTPIARIPGGLNSIAGTYTNRNHFAGLMELALPFGLAFYFSRTSRSDRTPNIRDWIRHISRFAFSTRPWHLAAVLSMLLALLSSASRGGTIAAAVSYALVAAGVAFFALSRQRDRMRPRIVGIMLVPIVIVVLLGADRLTARFERLGMSDSRYELRQMGYDMAADYPVFGAGPGTFRHLYPAYEAGQFAPGKFLHHVHNEYLELLIETGLLGFVLFGSALLIWFGAMSGLFRIRQMATPQRIGLASMAAAGSLMLHAFVDWNLQIPANTLWFSVVLALGLCARRLSPINRRREGV